MRTLVNVLRKTVKYELKFLNLARRSSTLPRSMKSWQIFKYGTVDDLKLEVVKTPIINKPSDVLIEVKAASINPIDIRMLGGYGSEAINVLRKKDGLLVGSSEFPLTLGRDFSGKVVDLGSDVNSKKFRIADEISLKPRTISHVQTASLAYVTCTTWAALSCFCKLQPDSFRDKKVLILGGSGGVGTFAIQLFRTWEAEVTTTVPSDFIEKASELGATNIIDYTQPDSQFLLAEHGRYDLIYDLTASHDLETNLKLLKPNACSKYVTIINPFLQNINELGFLLGLAKNGVQLISDKLQGLTHGAQVHWGVFYPSAEALDIVAGLVDSNKIIPVIDREYSFDDLPDAVKKVSSKHNRGKTVVDFNL